MRGESGKRVFMMIKTNDSCCSHLPVGKWSVEDIYCCEDVIDIIKQHQIVYKQLKQRRKIL